VAIHRLVFGMTQDARPVAIHRLVFGMTQDARPVAIRRLVFGMTEVVACRRNLPIQLTLRRSKTKQ
jgi:hypothetical protein